MTGALFTVTNPGINILGPGTSCKPHKNLESDGNKAQAPFMNHAKIEHNMMSNYKGLYGIFYKITMKVVKEVRAHCYCASLVRTLFIGHARATSFSSARTESKTDLCVNLVCEYFCWVLGDSHFFFGRSLSFPTLSIILKNKKNLCVGSFNYFSYTIKKGSNWYMDTGVRDFEVVFFKVNSS